jgi:hypothetical protein
VAEQLVTLRPNRGSDIEIDGTTYHLGLDTDWGESAVDASLLEGPDITGAVAGTRRLLTRQRSIVIQIRGTTGSGYLVAAENLNACVSSIQRYGGLIIREMEMDGDYSETLECEILEAGLTEAEDGWLEANRLHGEVVLSLVTNPAWLGDWEEAGSVENSTDSLIEIPVAALRGNLPSPGRIVLTDNASASRRFVELGGAFENFVSGQQTEFRADDFSLTGADGTSVSTGTPTVTDKIGTNTISVSPILPAWTTIGFLNALPQTGSHNIRARVLCNDEDVTVTVRALWRSGSGAWRELDSAPIPADGWWDLPLGTISHYDEAESIDIRFDVRATEVTSSTFRLNLATVTATDLYVVARGQTSQGAVTGASGFDDMRSDDTDFSSRTAQLGGAWTAFGSNDHFVDNGDVQTREYEDASLPAGRGYILNGLAATVTQTVGVGAVVDTNEKNSNTIVGGVFRYVDASNFGLCVMRERRTPSGDYLRYVTVYKNIAGTLTVVKQKAVDAPIGVVFISVDAAGAFEVFYHRDHFNLSQGEQLFTGSDSVFATSGTLETGKMGVYGASTGATNFQLISGFVGYSEIADTVTTDVIREDGTGELTYAAAFSADADGTDHQDVSSAEGRRIWLPPGIEGQLTAKIRTSDSVAEVDTGHTNSTDVVVHHRPAFASLSDSFSLWAEEDLFLTDDVYAA